MLSSTKAKVATIAAAAVVGLGGLGTGAALAASSSAPPSNLYGCVDGPGRVLEHVYTVESNYLNFLNANGGSCPGGFKITVNGSVITPTPTPTPTTPTPTPTATTPTPTPTPTATGAPLCVKTSLDRAECDLADDPNIVGGPNDSGVAVRQEVWNLKPALRKQELRVWSGHQWTATVNAAAGNTEVNNYPDVSNTVTTAQNTPNPVSSYKSLVSTYAENMHATAGTDAEAAYDIWLNNYSDELMIWVDNHGQRPAGNDTGQNITVGGNTYRLWLDNPDIVSLVLDHNAQTGTTDILGIINALTAKGIYANPGINQVNFGFETPSTGGLDEVFEVSAYTLRFS